MVSFKSNLISKLKSDIRQKCDRGGFQIDTFLAFLNESECDNLF